MTDIPVYNSFISQLSRPNNSTLQVYYRSKLFTVPFTTNSLVAAAGPLFSVLERLYTSPILPSVHHIRDNIDHELRAFHSRLAGRYSTDDFTTIAHYLLCATIDEFIGKSYLRDNHEIAQFKAFTPSSHNDRRPEQQFFDIIYYIKERPNQYLDLIELAYYCLIIGFEGIYHQTPDGRLNLDNLIDTLFQLIQYHRVNKTYQLFNEPQKKGTIVKSQQPFISVFFIFLSIVIVSFLVSYLLLEKKAQAIQHSHIIIDKLDK